MHQQVFRAILWVLMVALLCPTVVQAAGLERRYEGKASLPAPSTSPGEPGIHLIASTDDQITLELVVPEFRVDTDMTENEACDIITLDGFGASDTPGLPYVPVIGTLVEIPLAGISDLTIVDAEVVALPGTYALCPVPELIYDITPEGEVSYGGEVAIRDAVAYAMDAFYPAEPVEVVETGLIRDRRVAQLRFNPLQYNPVTGVVQLYQRIRLEVRLGGNRLERLAGVPGHPMSENGGDAFDGLMVQTVLNLDAAQEWREVRAQIPALLESEIPASGDSDPDYKLTVERDGIYQVTYAELSAAGVPVETLAPRTFALRMQGKDVALHVTGGEDGTFDPGDTLIFYGQKADTKYTDANVYWLTWGDVDGLRMAEVDGSPRTGGAVPSSFRTTVHMEENSLYQSNYPSGPDEDRWYWGYISASTAPASIDYTATLDAVAAEPVSATLRGLLRGYQATPQHHTQIYLNGHLVLDATWSGTGQLPFEVDVPQSILVEGANTLTLLAPMDMGITSDVLLINWFEIDYFRSYVPMDDALTFGVDTAGVGNCEVTEFSADDVWVFDITAPAMPQRVVDAVLELVEAAYTLHFGQDSLSERQYIAATPAKFEHVADITAARGGNLRATTQGADYVIITHGDFYTDVQPLADYRATQGLRTLVVNVQDIYDQFSGGLLDPSAIRAFLAFAYSHWVAPAPTYVLLVGDGSYDFKDYLKRGSVTYIPPYLADVDPWIGETAADNRYVAVSGDDVLPDMHLGRLPVRTRAETQAVVAKILDYEQNPAADNWNQDVLFVTDNPDSAGNFYDYSDVVANGYLPAPYVADKVYYGRTHTSSTSARSAILSALNEGRLVVNYVGHASSGQWASERLLERTTVGSLTNTARLPFIATMACLEGYYISPSTSSTDYSSLAEVFVRTEARGSIANWSATGMGLAYAHDFLNRKLFEAIFTHDVVELGPATTLAKLYLFSQTGGFLDQIDTYLLFGDPALRLNVLPADVSLAQSLDGPKSRQPGDSVVYTLSFGNAGPATAHNVVISDVVPSALVNLVITSTGVGAVTSNGTSLLWEVGTLMVGQSGAITISASIPSSFTGLLVNEVSITTSSVEVDYTNNAPDSADTEIVVESEEPTAVELVAFTVQRSGTVHLVSWQTGNELDTIGFYLYRVNQTGGQPIRLTGALIPVSEPGNLVGAFYTYTDATVRPRVPYLYWLEDVSLQGVVTRYGPVTVDAAPSMFLPVTVRLP